MTANDIPILKIDLRTLMIPVEFRYALQEMEIPSNYAGDGKTFFIMKKDEAKAMPVIDQHFGTDAQITPMAEDIYLNTPVEGGVHVLSRKGSMNKVAEESDKSQLEQGKQVELEHKSTIESLLKKYCKDIPENELENAVTEGAEMIAKDHLAEMSDYYSKLANMEKGSVEKAASSVMLFVAEPKAMHERGEEVVREDTTKDRNSDASDVKPAAIFGPYPTTRPESTGVDSQAYVAKNHPEWMGTNTSISASLKVNANMYMPTDTDLKKVVILNDNGGGLYTVRDINGHRTYTVTAEELITDEDYNNVNIF